MMRYDVFLLVIQELDLEIGWIGFIPLCAFLALVTIPWIPREWPRAALGVSLAALGSALLFSIQAFHVVSQSDLEVQFFALGGDWFPVRLALDRWATGALVGIHLGALIGLLLIPKDGWRRYSIASAAMAVCGLMAGASLALLADEGLLLVTGFGIVVFCFSLFAESFFQEGEERVKSCEALPLKTWWGRLRASSLKGWKKRSERLWAGAVVGFFSALFLFSWAGLLLSVTTPLAGEAKVPFASEVIFSLGITSVVLFCWGLGFASWKAVLEFWSMTGKWAGSLLAVGGILIGLGVYGLGRLVPMVEQREFAWIALGVLGLWVVWGVIDRLVGGGGLGCLGMAAEFIERLPMLVWEAGIGFFRALFFGGMWVGAKFWELGRGRKKRL